MTSFLSTPVSRRQCLAALGASVPLLARAQNRIDITHWVGDRVPPIPVCLSGFTGEVQDALVFDLEIAGCTIVNEAEAQYVLKGSSTGQVEARLLDRSGRTLFGRGYSAGSPRQQAHALSDVVIGTLGGKGVAQTRIAFKAEVAPGKAEIYLADYDGHNARAVTKDGSLVAAPTWVFGKFALLYTSYFLGNPDIFLHDLGSGTRRPFSRRPGLNTSAAASPDGERAAMILSKDGSPNLYSSRLDGTDLIRLTNNRRGDSSPCWSPDGRRLCYSSRTRGPSVLYIIEASGGTPRALKLAGVSNATEPDWSPDGANILFTTQSGGRFEVCIVPSSGGDVTRLTAGEDAVWAPNSRTILYARRVGNGVRVLSLLDVPTRQTKDLPRLSGSCSQPTWAR